MKINQYLFMIWIMFIIITAMFGMILREYEQATNYGCETCMLYNPDAKFGLNGIYFHKKFYCVWTGNRTDPEIFSTENHEKCHHLVAMDYEHFCE